MARTGHSSGAEEMWFKAEAALIDLVCTEGQGEGLLVLLWTKFPLKSAGKRLRKAARRKKQASWLTDRRASIFDIREDGSISPDRGKLEMASY